MSEVIQYDTSDHVVGGVNIAEAVQTDKRLLFNESYTVTGYKVESPSVYACYDLTVTGDLEAEEIEVHGELCVTGSIKAKRLYCEKTLFCGGDIKVDAITAGEILAGSIACKTLTCSGNVITKTTIDIGESFSADMSVMTGEGIVGNGEFSARNGVTAEYFSFEGNVTGRILDLESDEFYRTPSERPGAITPELRSIESGDLDEDGLLQALEQISISDENLLSDWRKLTGKLVEIAYLDKIVNLRDYLYIVMAKKILPAAVTGYETLEHIFSKLLPEAEEALEFMSYHAKDLDEVAYSLKVANFCESEIALDKEELYDRILQSFGIKYNTAKDYLG